ncbi:MAG: hypothetical protein J7M09_04480 [Deltaproteobacteria bacterium]|nr:hypothetical protein [Candidatus Tharpella sp.]
MESLKVPQDNISTLANHKKAIYATTETGAYKIIASSGWEVEEEVTKQALKELERLSAEAYRKALSGEVSPLYFHMYDQRMDPQILAQTAGISKWRLKRHFKAEVFARLSSKLLAGYAAALGLSVKELCCLPEREERGA